MSESVGGNDRTRSESIGGDDRIRSESFGGDDRTRSESFGGDDRTGRTEGTYRGEPVTETRTTREVRNTETQRPAVPTPAAAYDHVGKIKTSAAAVFALVFGLSALICAITALLSPVAVVFGIIAIILGIVGMKMGRRPRVSGRGVAISGLVLGLLGLLLGGAILGGATYFLNNDKAINRIDKQLQKARTNLPKVVPTAVPTP